MEDPHMTKGLNRGGCALIFFQSGFYTILKIFLIDFFSRIERFNPFLEDLGPFLRPYLGGKLEFCYPLQAYIN
jgi:hypothetical protein